MTFFKFLFVLVFTIVAPSFGWAANCNTANSIISVTNSKVGGFEFVTFKFKKTPALPQFSVTNVVPPFIQDGSGNTIIVAGARWTQVKFQQVEWICSTQQFLALPKPAVKAVKNIGQFEGQIVYVIGRSAASHYITTQTINAGAFTIIRIKLKP